MIKLSFMLLFVGLAIGEVCPDHYECPGATCCLLLNGIYGCCPYRNAVCCPDKIHCCSENEKCNVKEQKCESKLEALPYNWLLRSGFGAGRMFKTFRAPIMEDRRLSLMELNELEESVMQPIETFKNEIENITRDVIRCPDGRICKIGDSCCRKETGGFGCCPYVNALCCSDMIHCCPEGYRCDFDDNMCYLVEFIEETFPQRHLDEIENKTKTLVLSKIRNVGNFIENHENVCPNGQDKCANSATCCINTNKTYECCPYPNAVCCPDQVNCCPDNYLCDEVNNVCVHRFLDEFQLTIPFKSFDESTYVQNTELTVSSDIVCPNGKDRCHEGETCCQGDDKRYGCCAHPDAVCCTDGKHCCSNGYTCDLAHMQCVKNSGSFMRLTIPFTTLDSESKNEELPVSSDIVCPNGKDSCHEGETCCQGVDKRYGCCPYPNAVCCTDGKHCCPGGYTCDLADSQCIMNSGSFLRLVIPFATLDNASKNQNKLTALPYARYSAESVEEQETAPCPDGYQCQDNATCCQMVSGSYGCCPSSGAVCCQDRQHCCPHGTRCDVKNARCVANTEGERLSVIQPASEQKEYSLLQTSYKQMACQDGTNCADKSTCCKTKGGNYGCCPYENGSCCPDGIHCCPFGSKCDDVNRQCIHKSLANFLGVKESKSLMYNTIAEKYEVPLDVERAALPEKWDPMHQCPDKMDWCDKDDTCCKLPGGDYGCCDSKKGVCCDEWTCCPEKTICVVGGCAFPQQSVAINFVTINRIPFR